MRAENTGNVAEQTVSAVLAARGYPTIRLADLERLQSPGAQRSFLGATPPPTTYVLRQYPIGTSIYGLPLAADFFVAGCRLRPAGLAIEVKWQQSGGSVDEKFPYLVLNIQQCYTHPAIVIADGGGQRPGALAWLREQQGDQLLAVFTLAEFVAWANQQL